MATVYDRLELLDRAGHSTDYRDDTGDVDEDLEGQYEMSAWVPRRWRDTDDPDGLGLGVVMVRAPGIVVIRKAVLIIEPSAAALSDGAEFRIQETTATEFYLRSHSATQKGIWVLRDCFIGTGTPPSGDSDRFYLRTAATSEIVVRTKLYGDQES